MELDAFEARGRLWKGIAKHPHDPIQAFSELFGTVNESIRVRSAPDTPTVPSPVPKQLISAPLSSTAGLPVFSESIFHPPTFTYDPAGHHLVLGPKEMIPSPPIPASAADSPIGWVRNTAHSIPKYTFDAAGKLVFD
jgi:hypothetical protein